MARIFLSPPDVGERELELVTDAIRSNWVAPLGPHVDAFEAEFAKVVGVPHAAALSSGTAAIHLALDLLGVRAGDSVLCSTFTFCASANPITYLGAVPTFIDSSADSWAMDPKLLELALEKAQADGRLPKAVIVVDLYGQPADYDAISAVTTKFGVPVVEDAAEALGATYRGASVGRFGVLGCFSFNGNKIITTSGGGMLVSESAELIARARFLATQARDPAPHYQHSAVGYNYRLSNLCAAVGRAQLATLDQRVRKKREIFELYVEALHGVPGVTFMPEPSWGRATRWLTCILVDPARFGADREAVRVALEAADIEARPLWKPLHMQPVFADCPRFGGEVAEELFRLGLCLPSGTRMTHDDVRRVAEVIRRVGRRSGAQA